jgi:Uma2 family endonuclease
MLAAGHHRYTWHEYLVLEHDSPTKHEFFDGEIYAMAGGTPQHALLASQAIGELNRQLKGKPCKTYTSDLRVRVAATGLATYPDVAVICGGIEPDAKDANTAVNPTVLVEVLSPSTEEYDRVQKFENYRQMPSLQEYVLISHREKLIEVFRRRGDEWVRTEARSHASAKLESIGCELAVDDVYDGVELQSV